MTDRYRDIRANRAPGPRSPLDDGAHFGTPIAQVNGLADTIRTVAGIPVVGTPVYSKVLARNTDRRARLAYPTSSHFVIAASAGVERDPAAAGGGRFRRDFCGAARPTVSPTPCRRRPGHP